MIVSSSKAPNSVEMGGLHIDLNVLRKLPMSIAEGQDVPTTKKALVETMFDKYS
jgi:hypothetical protein